MLAEFKRSFNNQKGQTMVEYALLLALVAVAVAAMFTQVGNAIRTAFSSLVAAF